METGARFRLCFLIGLIAFIGQLLAPVEYVHGFTPLRLWQFMIGIGVYYWTNEEVNEKKIENEVEVEEKKVEKIAERECFK
jgi:hypothetical protein